MAQPNDQLMPVDPLQQALYMAQMGQPTAPSHDPGQVQAQMLQALMAQRQAEEFGYRPPRRMEQFGWGSALSELARPFVSKRMSKKANEELATALGKKGDLDRYDAAIAEYKAGIAAAQKQVDEATMYERKKQVDQRYAAPEKDPDKVATLKWIQQQPPEQQAALLERLLPGQKPDKTTMGTANIGGMVVPTINGVPQMDKSYGQTESAITAEDKKKQAADDKASGHVVLAEKMRSFTDLLTDPNFESSVGPYDSNFAVRGFGKLFDTENSRVHRKIDRLAGKEVLDLGALALKGSQTEGEWQRVAATLPSDSDHAAVWYAWFNDALRILEAGAPELVEKLEPLRKQIYDNADKTGIKWEGSGKYEPFGGGGSSDIDAIAVKYGVKPNG